MIKRKKPLFYRQGWDRYLRLGKTVKKKRKWRAANGGDSKTRLKENGYAIRPTIGWGSSYKIRNKILGMTPIRIETLSDFSKVTDKKNQGVMLAHVGRKKKIELTAKANEMGIKILNKYRAEKK